MPSSNPSSHLNSPESFRIFVTNVVPGAIVVFPLLHIFFLANDIALCGFIKKYPTSFFLGYFSLSCFLGMIIEDLGAQIEVFLEKKVFPKTPKADSEKVSHDTMYKTWNEYLRLDIHSNPVGHRYLKTIVTRLKFENNSCVSCGLFATLSIILISYFKICAYLIFEATQSIELPHKTRENILLGPFTPNNRSSYTS